MQAAQIELARLLDLSPSVPLQAKEQLTLNLVPEAPQAKSAIEAVTFALDNRSEIAVSQATNAQQASLVAAERGSSIPRLEAFGEASYGGFYDEDEDLGWTVGIELTIPIYHDGSHRLSAARHRQAQRPYVTNNSPAPSKPRSGEL